MLKDQRGQSLPEFALVLPILTVLLFGMIEFGQVINSWLVITNAAREGARYGVLGHSASQIDAQVRSAANGLNMTNLTVQVVNSQGSSGTPLTVTVNYTIQILTPLIANLFPQNPFPVTSSTTMRTE